MISLIALYFMDINENYYEERSANVNFSRTCKIPYVRNILLWKPTRRTCHVTSSITFRFLMVKSRPSSYGNSNCLLFSERVSTIDLQCFQFLSPKLLQTSGGSFRRLYKTHLALVRLIKQWLSFTFRRNLLAEDVEEYEKKDNPRKQGCSLWWL